MKLFLALLVAVGFGGYSTAGCGDYSSMDCSQLWYSRNALFAEEGYCFKSPAAIKVFGKVCNPPNYGRLSPEEKAVIREIRYWERKKGCSRKKFVKAEHYGGCDIVNVIKIRPGDELTVRSRPGTHSPRVGGLPYNAKGIEVLDCRLGWCKIRYGGLSGWVSDRYLSLFGN